MSAAAFKPFEPYDVVVAGAGISGLACAWTLKQAGKRVVVLEAADRVGGCITTVRHDGFIADGGPQTFVANEPFVSLLDSLGVASSLQRARAGSPFVFAHGRLMKLPASPPSLVVTPLLSPLAKLRLLAEPFIGARVSDDDESLASFAARRGGRAVVDALVRPMVGGIFAGDPARLSARSAFPALVEAERQSGSVLLGSLAALRRRGTRTPGPRRLPASLAGGNDALPRAIAAGLGSEVRLGARVVEMTLRGANIELAYEGVSSSRGAGSVVARRAVLALPAWASADLLERLEPEAATALRAVPHASIAQVALAYPTSSVPNGLEGFGFLTGSGAQARILGCVWNSAMFADRSPSGQTLVTAFLGGTQDPGTAALADAELVRAAHADVSRALGIAVGAPTVVAGFRWERAIPQYDIGHRDRLSAIDASLRRLPQVRLAGNFFSGPSVGECIARGVAIAQSLVTETAIQHP